MLKQRWFVAGLLYWLVLTGTATLYVMYWRLWIGWPPAWSWLGSTLAVLLTLAWLTVEVLIKIRQGPGRLLPAACLLLVFLPLIAGAGLIGRVAWTADHRGNLQFTTPVRVGLFWALGMARVEANLRYPDRYAGRHIDLFQAANAGDRNDKVRGWVKAMDRHVDILANRLERSPSDERIAWVRGELLGMNGRAIGGVAICNGSRDGPRYLDYHEVAHCVITLMAGPDQYPPMLLAEGWAEAGSSADFKRRRQVLIDELGQQVVDGRSITLRECVSTARYGRSAGSAYSHGGPFVIYLLERFGGRVFFRLYREVRPATFFRDAEQILGTGWDELERDFWAWLEENRTDS